MCSQTLWFEYSRSAFWILPRVSLQSELSYWDKKVFKKDRGLTVQVFGSYIWVTSEHRDFLYSGIWSLDFYMHSYLKSASESAFGSTLYDILYVSRSITGFIQEIKTS